MSLGGQSYTPASGGYQSFYNPALGMVTTTPIQNQRRKGATTLRLLKSETGETVWGGEAVTSGQGAIATTDDAFLASLKIKVVRSLIESPHF